jgi:hypothetical protein
MFLFLLLTTLHTLQSGVRTATEQRSARLTRTTTKPANTTEILLGFSSSSKGIKESNGLTAYHLSLYLSTLSSVSVHEQHEQR